MLMILGVNGSVKISWYHFHVCNNLIRSGGGLEKRLLPECEQCFKWKKIPKYDKIFRL